MRGGAGDVATGADPLDDLDRVLFHEGEIHRRLDELAERITADFRGKPLTVLAILNGSLVFMADLLRRIPLPLQLGCVSAASYHGGVESSGVLELGGLDRRVVDGRHVLLLDDILDSGLTLSGVAGRIREESDPLEIRSCVLLAKRKERPVEVAADYVAFEIRDEFVVGYGLDFAERYRNLPCVGVLRADVIAAAGR